MTPAPRGTRGRGQPVLSFVRQLVVGSLADQAGDLADREDMTTNVTSDAGEGGKPDGPEQGFD